MLIPDHVYIGIYKPEITHATARWLAKNILRGEAPEKLEALCAEVIELLPGNTTFFYYLRVMLRVVENEPITIASEHTYRAWLADYSAKALNEIIKAEFERLAANRIAHEWRNKHNKTATS